jgi:hypothetical protein
LRQGTGIEPVPVDAVSLAAQRVRQMTIPTKEQERGRTIWLWRRQILAEWQSGKLHRAMIGESEVGGRSGNGLANVGRSTRALLLDTTHD